MVVRQFVKKIIFDDHRCVIQTNEAMYIKKEESHKISLICINIDITDIQSTLYEMLGWMTHKLESGLLGEISTT